MSTTAKVRSTSKWSALESTLCAVVAVLLIGVICIAAVKRIQHEQTARFTADAQAVTQVFENALYELDTLMTPFASMHAGASSTEDMVALASELQAQIGFVTGFGRYASVDDNSRDEFERSLLDSGLYEFNIIELDEGGSRQSRARAEHYYPVTLLEPMEPRRLRLIGADFGAIPGLGDALDRMVANNSALISTLPDNWPTRGELILFRAGFHGQRIPTDSEERSRRSSGGYWMLIDPLAILASANDALNRFDISLTATDTGGTTHTLINGGRSTDRPGLTASLDTPVALEHRWTIGDGDVTMQLRGNLSIPNNFIIGLAMVSVLIIAIAAICAAYLRHRRQAMHERQLSEQAVHSERERADRTLNAIDDAVISLSIDHLVAHVNPAAERLLERARAELLGKPLTTLLALAHENSPRPFDLIETLNALDKGGRREFDVQPAQKKGTSRATVLRMTMSRTRDTSGEISGYILVFRDISDERQLTRRLEYQANHDELTGCTNRRYFEARLAALLDDMPISGRTHALCYIDLDQFKIVNDTNGHGAGDSLLQELTVRLQSLCRQGDVLSRLGGDEFGLLIVDARESDARAVADKIHAFFQKFDFLHGNHTFSVTASIGFVPLNERSGLVGDVLAAADLACYAAKEGGRNALYVYSTDDATLSQRSSELNRLPELRNALDKNLFSLHVQAVASINQRDATFAPSHFEFLLRLNGDDGKAIAPFQIIEAAERYGLMREIDRWVITHAIKHVSTIQSGPGATCSYSINLSGQSAADPTLIDFIEGLYATYNIEPERIWFELTETAAISQFSVAVELATRIRKLGSKVALDDFGSGLSSFGYLKSIPVDVLKIDGQFVKNIVDDPVDRTMVQAINDVAQSMGIATVAEFVENAAIVDVLREIGIDYAQGYHIGKPCPFSTAMAGLDGPDQLAA